MSTLFYGDNLDVLREHIPNESVDLIYLDPPFNSARDYNVLFAEKDESGSDAQIRAFEDSWHWGLDAERAYKDLTSPDGRSSEKLITFVEALRSFLGTNDMMAYLTMMAIRLVELRRVLKPKGSIYLHCDPTASHHLKLLMDAIFGVENFAGEVIWKRTGAHGSAKRWSPVHDTILYYGAHDDRTWNAVKGEPDPDYIEAKFTEIDEDTGRAFQGISLTGDGVRHGESGQPWRDYDPTHVGDEARRAEGRQVEV